ncbi:torsin-1A-interacting protein 2-like [Enoplosus armatus]|uniref:torsin-1A-interacting protein 2-like n=1 Tax=Enoplosus armatus TaxID=215367 RepID=UPI0039927579
MAEQDTHQHTAETQYTNMDLVSSSNKDKQEETDVALNVKEHHLEDSDSAEEKRVPLTEGSSSPDEASTQNGEGTSFPPEAEDGHGDNGETQKNEQPILIGEYHAGENKAPETTTAPPLGDGKDDQVDGPEARLHEETPGTNNANTEAREDEESDLEKVLAPEEENDVQETSPQTAVPQQISVEEERDEQENNVETIGPQETTEHIAPVDTGGSRRYLMVAIGIVVAAILLQHLRQPESPPQKNDGRQIDIFLEEMEKVKSQFPKQRAELWNRSRIHLLKHLQTAQPTEPVSLILTAGLRAEKTLHCLAQALASAFSSALNASVLHIDGASKASQDSDQVKLDIDSKLQGAFEGDKPVAVIHRFEELPPGSTLIFYRYCDHENAAYKKTCLMFTVLLEEEEEISANSRLSIVEEMVDDHLQKKFLSDDHPVSFDRMDLDKYGGLWSRISHLILPVAVEERIEHEGCKGA